VDVPDPMLERYASQVILEKRSWCIVILSGIVRRTESAVGTMWACSSTDLKQLKILNKIFRVYMIFNYQEWLL